MEEYGEITNTNNFQEIWQMWYRWIPGFLIHRLHNNLVPGYEANKRNNLNSRAYTNKLLLYSTIHTCMYACRDQQMQA